MAETWTERLPRKSSECYHNPKELDQNQYWYVFLLTLSLYSGTLHFAVEYTNVNLSGYVVLSVKARSNISDNLC
jgi:hypothetical protein